MNFIISSESKTSLRNKHILVLIEHNNLRRSNTFSIPISEDANAYVQANWADLWSSGEFAEDDSWLKHEEKQFTNLYKSVIRAGIRSARQEGATLTDMSDAMEDLIAVSPKSQHLSKLQTMAAASTAAQRDRFFLLCAFLFLSKTLGED